MDGFELLCLQRPGKEAESELSTRDRDRMKSNVTLSTDRERIHATHRSTAVELATCPRQCAVALQSNFCRHTHRMVNP
jgi:hypothetical protein